MMMIALRLALAFTLILPLALCAQLVWGMACVAIWPIVATTYFITGERGFQKFFWGDFAIFPMAMFKNLVDAAFRSPV